MSSDTVVFARESPLGFRVQYLDGERFEERLDTEGLLHVPTIAAYVKRDMITLSTVVYGVNLDTMTIHFGQGRYLEVDAPQADIQAAQDLLFPDRGDVTPVEN